MNTREFRGVGCRRVAATALRTGDAQGSGARLIARQMGSNTRRQFETCIRRTVVTEAPLLAAPREAREPPGFRPGPPSWPCSDAAATICCGPRFCCRGSNNERRLETRGTRGFIPHADVGSPAHGVFGRNDGERRQADHRRQRHGEASSEERASSARSSGAWRHRDAGCGQSHDIRACEPTGPVTRPCCALSLRNSESTGQCF